MSNIVIYDTPGGPSGTMLKTHYFLPEGGSKYRLCNPSGGVIRTSLKNNDSFSWSTPGFTWTLSNLTFTAATASTPAKASGNWKLKTFLTSREIGDVPTAEEEGTFVAQAGGRVGGDPPAEEAASSASA